MKNRWTLERCKADALKYDSKGHWADGNPSAYRAALRNEWMDECCKHMEGFVPENRWTLERCKEEALKYETRSEWGKGSPPSYKAAHRNGWMDECSEHMVPAERHRKDEWTLERCLKDARRYKVYIEWRKDSYRAYHAAFRNGWLDECTKHMKKGRVDSGSKSK